MASSLNLDSAWAASPRTPGYLSARAAASAGTANFGSAPTLPSDSADCPRTPSSASLSNPIRGLTAALAPGPMPPSAAAAFSRTSGSLSLPHGWSSRPPVVGVVGCTAGQAVRPIGLEQTAFAVSEQSPRSLQTPGWGVLLAATLSLRWPAEAGRSLLAVSAARAEVVR